MGNIYKKPFIINNYQYDNIEIYLSSLSDNITELNLNNLNLTSLPDLKRFTNLKKLSCILNELTILPNLPRSITILIIRYNQLNNISNISELCNLTELDCSYNNLYELPTLPDNLLKLYCSENNIYELPVLPFGLKELICSNEYINDINIKLYKLPKLYHLYNLQCVICDNTNISSFPEFQLENMEYISCDNTPFLNKLLLSEDIEINNISMENKINYIYKYSTILTSIR